MLVPPSTLFCSTSHTQKTSFTLCSFADLKFSEMAMKMIEIVVGPRRDYIGNAKECRQFPTTPSFSQVRLHTPNVLRTASAAWPPASARPCRSRRAFPSSPEQLIQPRGQEFLLIAPKSKAGRSLKYCEISDGNCDAAVNFLDVRVDLSSFSRSC